MRIELQKVREEGISRRRIIGQLYQMWRNNVKVFMSFLYWVF